MNNPLFHPLSLLDRDKLPQEIEQGNIEYKLKLIDKTDIRKEQLTSQMKWRLAEGYGEALYEIGIADNGILVGLSKKELEGSIETLKEIGAYLKADVSIIRERMVNDDPERRVAEVLVRKSINEEQFMEIIIAVVGGFDSGKSTLLGVLGNNEVDNGRGKARLNLLRHRHEIASGRTSSVSRQVIGFDAMGNLINFSSTNISTMEQICEVSCKIIHFLDLPGNPKYQRTAISGLTGNSLDYASLIVAANSGVLSDTAKEHLNIAVALNVPVFICLTKIDVSVPNQLKSTVQSLLNLLKSPALRRIPLIIKSKDDIVTCIANFVSSKVIPIFLLSSVTRENVDLFSEFLNLLPKPIRDYQTLSEKEMEFQIEEVYSVPDVGCVVAGILNQGRLNLQNNIIHGFLGPDKGIFTPICIHSIHRQRCKVNQIEMGQVGTLAISFPNQDASNKPPKGFRIRKGQVILPYSPAEAIWEFEAEMHVLSSESEFVSNGSQGVVFCGNIRQGVKIVHVDSYSPMISPELIAVGKKYDIPEPSREYFESKLFIGQYGKIRFKFISEPEWLTLGNTILFRGKDSKCVGKITLLYKQFCVN